MFHGRTHCASRESAGLDGQVRVRTHSLELSRKIENNLFVASCFSRCRVLMLLDRSNLRVDGRLVAGLGGTADWSCVALQSAKHEGIRHPCDVVCSLSIGEGLICNVLL